MYILTGLLQAENIENVTKTTTTDMKKTVLFIAMAFVFSTSFAQTQPVDTTKKDPVQYLPGRESTFSLLYTALLSPDDITPNQKKALAEWILKQRVTVPEPKKEELPVKMKPKN